MIFFRKRRKENLVEEEQKIIEKEEIREESSSAINARINFERATVTGAINGNICGVIQDRPFMLSVKGLTTENELVLENTLKTNMKSDVPYRHINIDDRDLFLIPLIDLNQSHKVALRLNGKRVDIDYCLSQKILELDTVTLLKIVPKDCRLYC